MTPEQETVLQRLIHAAQGEALFRPSSASGWIACAGRVQLSALAPRGERRSSYADEGTAAHIVFNQALTGERQPDEWTDRQVKINDMTGVFVDEEMVEAITWCVDQVADLMGDDPGTEMFLEHPLTLSALDPSDPLLAQNRGTGDVVLVNRFKRWLKIIDLKYGKGVMVVSDSPQLLNYALMGLVTWGTDGGWESIESVVLQPRASGTAPDFEDERRTIKDGGRFKQLRLKPDELLIDFISTAISAMEASLQPNPPLVTGDHCRWCPARSYVIDGTVQICPAVQEQALAIADDSHASPPALATVMSMLKPIPKMPDLPLPNRLSGADLATILERRVVYDAWIDACEQAAARLLEIGGLVPGWTLRARSGHRKFKDIKTAIRVLKAKAGLKPEDFMTEPTLRSPAQVEKITSPSKRGLFDPLAKDTLVERPQGALQLVRLKGDEIAQATTTAALMAIPKEAR